MASQTPLIGVKRSPQVTAAKSYLRGLTETLAPPSSAPQTLDKAKALGDRKNGYPALARHWEEVRDVALLIEQRFREDVAVGGVRELIADSARYGALRDLGESWAVTVMEYVAGLSGQDLDF